MNITLDQYKEYIQAKRNFELNRNKAQNLLKYYLGLTIDLNNENISEIENIIEYIISSAVSKMKMEIIKKEN